MSETVNAVHSTAIEWLDAQTKDLGRAWNDFDQDNQSQIQGAWFRLAVIGVMALTQLAYNVLVVGHILAKKDETK